MDSYGQGKRMGTKIQKQYLELKGKPILYYSLYTFEKSEFIDEVILVVGEGQEEYCEREIVTKTVEVDMPSRLAARRKMFNMINKIKDENGKNIDLTAKLFGEYADKYKDRTGGYTRILKLGQRRGDGAEVVILELV